MSSPLKLVVFDVDGTLIDSQAMILSAMSAAFTHVGLEVPAREDILSIVGLSLPVALAELAPPARDDQDLLDRMIEGYKTYVVDQRAQNGAEAAATFYPGARDALDRLAARPELFMGMATGKARRGVEHLLDSQNLRAMFHTTQSADEHPSKPHPSMMEACLRDTGVEARHAVMIGDTEFDIAMGKAAGMAAIGVSWGYHPVARLHGAGADLVIDRFEDLDAALAQIWAEGGA